MSKSILITGSNSGFGRLSVETLAKDGHRVFATMRNVAGKNAAAAEELENWAKENNYDVHVVELDVTSDASVAAAVESVLAKTDRLDVIVNNAGIFGGSFNEAMSLDDHQKIFDVNVFGPIRVTNGFLPQLRKQKEGLIITVSSIMGRFVIPFTGAYTASKWAIEAYAESYRYDLAHHGIDSTIIEPGAFPTEITQKVVQPGNGEVIGEYGKSAEMLEKFWGTFAEMLSGENAPNPQLVADAVKTLVDTPAGNRPLRTVVDPLSGQLAEGINAGYSEAQNGYLDMSGFGELKSVAPAPVEA